MKERALFKFRLYTADHTMNSTEALANLTALCAPSTSPIGTRSRW
jgi:hypothetical protein